MSNIPMPQQIYKHFKGNLYQIVTLAKHSETSEMLVIYQALYGDYRVYARPLSLFTGKVDKIKYPDAKQEYRFELQSDRTGNYILAEQKEQSGSMQTPWQKKQEKDIIAEEQEEQPDSMLQDALLEQTGQEELKIDPLVLEFLDAGTYEERLNILAALHHRITDEMINTMAVAVDLEVKEGEIEERYLELRNCLLTFDKFECNRLR